MNQSLKPGDLPAIFTSAEAKAQGVSNRRLYRWRDEGAIEQIGRGLFRQKGGQGDPDLIEISARAPLGTLCLVTALARHGLTDEIPRAIDVALPRKQRPPRTAAPVVWHRFDEATFHLDRSTIVVARGYRLGIYGPTRSVIDAFRLRHLEGHEQAVEALRRWLRLPKSQPARLLTMLKKFPSTEKSIRATLEILL